jgi:PAS domain S-box-containing protein
MPTLLLLSAGLAAGAAIAFLVVRRRQRRAAARWGAASRVGVVLAEELENPNAIVNAMRVLVPEYADWCTLHVVEDQQVRRAAVLHANPSIEDRLREVFARSPFVVDAPSGPATVIRSGRPLLVRQETATVAEQPDPALLREAGVSSYVSAPLSARGKVVGALTLFRRRPDGYDESDLAWIEDMARRIGLSVEIRRLFAETRELFEQTVSANFVSAPDGKMIACNRTYAELLGFESVDDVLAANAAEFYADLDELQEFLDALRRATRISGRAMTMRRRDGRPLAVSMNAVGTFGERGELVKVSGFVIDRTEQQELEEKLNQIQRLEAVGQLAGGIAHDFNNLLTVIIGCVDLLREQHRPAPLQLPDPLDELAKAANRAAALTQQLLAFSRRQVLQPRAVDLNDALRGAHSMLSRLLPGNMDFVLNLDPDVDHVKVDPTQLDQVIMNLVVNAGDAMPSGGTLTLSTRNIVLTDADVARHPYIIKGPYVSLLVRDTGTGMDEGTRARAFEPFFTTKPVGKGTGLGLSTVYGIVKQSGGYVWLTSAPGEGTTVQVCLPPAHARATAP